MKLFRKKTYNSDIFTNEILYIVGDDINEACRGLRSGDEVTRIEERFFYSKPLDVLLRIRINNVDMFVAGHNEDQCIKRAWDEYEDEFKNIFYYVTQTNELAIGDELPEINEIEKLFF